MERSSLYPDISAERQEVTSERRMYTAPAGSSPADNATDGTGREEAVEKRKRLTLKTLVIVSLVIFFVVLPLCDIISFFWVLVGYGAVTIVLFCSAFAFLLTTPCWYCGGCCFWGLHTRKIKEACGPKFTWRDTCSSCYLNGWLCLFLLLFFVFVYVFGMMSVWAPSSNAEYWRFYVLDDKEDPANVTSFDSDNYVFFWNSGYVLNNTAGRAVENGILYCVFPVIWNSEIPLNISTPLNINLLIGCMHDSYKLNGNELTCQNVTNSDGAKPRCFANVNQRYLDGYVGINQQDYLFNGLDPGWDHAMTDLNKHFPEYYIRPMSLSSPLIVDMLNEKEYDERKDAAKSSFVFLFVFIHITVLASLCCWTGCYWISSQILDDKCFDDALYLAGDEEAHSLVRRARTSTPESTRLVGGTDPWSEKEQESSNGRSKGSTTPKRGQYDVLDRDNEVFSL